MKERARPPGERRARLEGVLLDPEDPVRRCPKSLSLGEICPTWETGASQTPLESALTPLLQLSELFQMDAILIAGGCFFGADEVIQAHDANRTAVDLEFDRAW